jgi:urease accessory protein
MTTMPTERRSSQKGADARISPTGPGEAAFSRPLPLAGEGRVRALSAVPLTKAPHAPLTLPSPPQAGARNARRTGHGRSPRKAGPANATTPHLLRLLTWLSPAFPVGAYSYSHGLETAIRARTVFDAETLMAWISGLVEHGGGWTDAVLFKAAWRAASEGDAAGLEELAELSDALPVSLERRRETLGQGEAFLTAARAWGPAPLEGVVAYPVAAGALCGATGVPLEPALAAWLHAFAANLVSVAVRIVPLGQTAGVKVIADLEPVLLATATRAGASSLDDLGSAAILSDIAAMRHETLDVRLFIS